eukprot:COSAG02_NODE_4668_length_5113_cov_5.806143_1_plen_75_part_00
MATQCRTGPQSTRLRMAVSDHPAHYARLLWYGQDAVDYATAHPSVPGSITTHARRRAGGERRGRVRAGFAAHLP